MKLTQTIKFIFLTIAINHFKHLFVINYFNIYNENNKSHFIFMKSRRIRRDFDLTCPAAETHPSKMFVFIAD